MRIIVLCFVFLLAGACADANAYDSSHRQRVKYNQQRAKWKIKAAKERMKKKRSTSSYGSSSSSSSSSRSRSRSRSSQSRYGSSSRSRYGTSSSRSRSSASRYGTRKAPSIPPQTMMQGFITAANQATRLEDLYPYTLSTKVSSWKKLNRDAKQKELMKIKRWTANARVLKEENRKAMVTTLKMHGSANLVHMWVDRGQWKFSDVSLRK